MRLVLLPAAPADIVDGIEDAGIDVAVVLCRRFAADVGRCRDNGLLKAVAQLVAERLLRDGL